MLLEANEYLLAHKDDDKNNPTPSSAGGSDDDTSKEENKGTLTLDATCALANIRYPQDISHLNEAREKMETIIKLYEQQKYMYDNKVHSVEYRIVSISQPWLRPIVREKVKAPVEFGVDINNGTYKYLLNQQTLK